MRDDQFVMILPSNSSMRYFPHNTTSSFITELPQSLHLHGEWEVALSEIQFPSTFYHILPEESEFRFADVDPNVGIIPAAKRGKISYGIYNNIESLVSAINKACTTVGSHIRLEIPEDYGRRVCFTLACSIDKCKQTHYINLSDNLLRILGYGKEIVESTRDRCYTLLTTINSKNETYTGLFLKLGDADAKGNRTTGYRSDEAYSLARGIRDKLFVYCDICEPYITGDIQSPLLRIVPVEVHGENYIYGASQVKQFSSLHYIPLRQTNFRRIEIDIKDELGERIPFQSGTLTATLHFRRFQ